MKNTNKRHLAVAICCALGLGLLAVPETDVLAYSLTGVSWPGASATYKLNPNFTDPSAGSADDQLMALRSGADEWRLTGQGNFEFIYGGQTTQTNLAADGQNIVFYNPGDGGGALAVCWYWFVGASITNFDIEFYDRDGGFDFVWATNPTGSQFDIQGVATHEFGHALGLSHSSVSTATMFPTVAAGDTTTRNLDADDVAGYQSIYGAAGPATPMVSTVTPSRGWIDGGVTVTVNGSNFPGGVIDVKFGTVPATSVTRLSSTRLTCNVPAGTVPGKQDVSVTAEGETGTLPQGYEYDTIRYTGGGAALGTWHPMEVRVPAAPSTIFQGLLSLGQDGVVCSSFGDPGDNRVVPISVDWLSQYCVFYSGDHIARDIVGLTDGTGTHLWEFNVPNLPSLQGVTFYVSFVLGDTGSSPSGISFIGNNVPMYMPFLP
ncbi:MAG: hypothetical protein CMJ83_20785 [Planctomycetes bacterium]|nr:hypothetical protein [Planctomycetota bacterium]